MDSRWIVGGIAAVVAVILLAVLALGGFIFFYRQQAITGQRAMLVQARQAETRALRAAAQAREGAEAGNESRRMELDSLESDPGTVRSILDGLEIHIELSAVINEMTWLWVRLEKPLGRRYLVDGIENSSILYAGGRPWALLKRDHGREDVREILLEDIGSMTATFSDFPVPPEGAELKVEWINYNPRTGTVERLSSTSRRLDASEKASG